MSETRQLEDSDNLKEYLPKENSWFKTTFTYEGEGKAVFDGSIIITEGPSKIVFSENGETEVEMDVQRVEGNLIKEILQNPCFRTIKSVEIKTSDGVFTSRRQTNLSFSQYQFGGDGNTTLGFSTLGSQYDVSSAGTPTY